MVLTGEVPSKATMRKVLMSKSYNNFADKIIFSKNIDDRTRCLVSITRASATDEESEK